MNILPLVSAFIVLFALGFYTLFHQFRATVQEKVHYTESIEIQRIAAAASKAEIYKTLYKGKDPYPKKKSTSDADKADKETGEYKSPRETFQLFEESKLNLSFLAGEKRDPLVESVALNLLTRLYEFTDLHTPNMEADCLKKIIGILNEHPTLDSFEKMLGYLPEEDLPLFYKLIKGTNIYTVGEFIGFPALGDFFTLNPDGKKPIFFNYASMHLLSAAFSERIAQNIYAKEKEKWEEKKLNIPLRKKDLATLLESLHDNLQNYGDLFTHSNTKKTKTEAFYRVDNPSSRLQLRIQK